MPTDFYADANVGEVVEEKPYRITEVVKYNGTVTKGDGLKISSVGSDGIPVVVQSGAGEKARFVALQSGVSGDYKEALRRGLVKVTFSTAVTVDAPVKAGASGKFAAAVRTVTVPTGGAGTGDGGALTVEGYLSCGHARCQPTGDGDTGLIYFDGEGS